MNDMPSPVENGWQKEDGYLVRNYLPKDHSLKNNESLMTCKCTTGCRTNAYLCRKNSLSCTEACLCPENTCNNYKQWTSSTTCDEEYQEYDEEEDNDD